MDQIQNVIANNLIYLRRKNNLTQQDLASKINYSDNAISRWERSESTPSVETLHVIATYFGIKISDLLDENFPVLNNVKTKGTRIKRIFTILFSVSITWTFSLIAFFYCMMFQLLEGNEWLVFVVSVPLSCLLLLFYNRIWGNGVYHLAIMSTLWWSLITSLYLYVLFIAHANVWLLFLLGIPLQLAQVLWFLVKR